MKRICIFFSLLSFFQLVFAQDLSIPFLWFRADRAQSQDSVWMDVSGNSKHAIPFGQIMPTLIFGMNFNQCFEIQEGGFRIPLDDDLCQEMDAIIVYETADSAIENGLWKIALDSSWQVGLSSQCILNEHGNIYYDSVNQQGYVINFLSQAFGRQNDADSIRHSDFKSSLILGSYATIPFSGKLSEFVFFNHRIGDTAIVQWLSYLALKYGITLKKMNYLDSKGRCIWHYDTAKAFSYSIAGIGRDSIMGLNQKQTYFADQQIVFGLGDMAYDNESNPLTMSNEEYIIMGMDSTANAISSLYLSDGRELAVMGKSLVQVSANNPSRYSTFLRLDSALVKAYSPTLVIDRSGTGEYPLDETVFLYPDSIDSSGFVFFQNIQWDMDGSGMDAFCILLQSMDTSSNEMRKSTMSNENIKSIQNGNYYSLTPNPNRGNYSIEISFIENSDVHVKICTLDGKLVKSFTGQGQSNYIFEDCQRSNGLYLIDIQSSLEHKVLKMVVL